MAIDIISAFENDPPTLDFIWPGFLAGTVGALVAPGATGKSFLALQAAMSIACSVAGGDLVGLRPRHTGRVVYLAGEDPPPALINRLHAIGRHLPANARAAIAEQLTLEPIMGERMNVMERRQLARVVERCAGSRLVILDTLELELARRPWPVAKLMEAGQPRPVAKPLAARWPGAWPRPQPRRARWLLELVPTWPQALAA